MARSEEEYRKMLEEDPTSMEAFSALRRTWQTEEKWADLVWLYEVRGNALDEDIRKADMYFKAADLFFEKLSNQEEGMRLLYMGVLLDPRHRRNARKVRDYLKEKGDQERYLAILEKEIEFLQGQGQDRRALAQLHQEVGMLLARSEENAEAAVTHLKTACAMDPSLSDASALIAEIYLTAKNYEEALPYLLGELKTVRDPAQRAQKLALIGKIQLDHKREPETAEATLQEALGLAPDNMEILNLLMEVYLDRRYPKEKDPARKVAQIFLQMARHHHAQQETSKAVEALKQALAHDPSLKEAFSLLATIWETAGEWTALADLFSSTMNRNEGKTKLRLGLRLAEILEVQLQKPDEAKRILEEVLQPEFPEAVRPKLIEFMERREDWDGLARVLEREVATLPAENTSSARLQLVRLYRDRLNRPDKAARHLHELLKIDPENIDVLDLYIQHFREKGDWRSQVETMETALRVAHAQGIDTSYIIQLLKEMASIYRNQLGDLARTERVMKFLVRLDPENPRYKASYEKIRQQREVWEGYKNEMQQEIAATADPASRLELMRSFASTLLERKLDVELCIELYQSIVQSCPGDPEAYDALEQLLTMEGNLENLFQLMEARLAESTEEQKDEILRRLFDLARDKLKDPSRLGRIASKILEITPDDTEALQALVESLENLENWPKLTALLERWSMRIVDPEEKKPLLLKAADVYERRLSKPEEAARCLRQIYDNRMDLETVIPRLLELYEHMGNYLEYANLLENSLREGDWPTDPQQVLTLWKRLGQVLERQAQDPARALSAWKALWEQFPEDVDAVTHVTRLAYTLEQWDLLVEVMEDQVQKATDPEKINNLALRLSEIYEQRLNRPHDALAMLERVEASRRDQMVQERLVRLRIVTGDFEGAMEILRDFMEKTDILEQKVGYSLQIAKIYIDLHDDASASMQLDHVLELDPSNTEALVLQLDLCEREGRWERLVELHSQLFTAESDPDRRFVHARRLGELHHVQLERPDEAFRWYRMALELHVTDAEILESIEKVASENGFWTELSSVYEFLLRNEWSSERDILQKAVDVQRSHLKDYACAMDWVTRYLMRNPTDEEFVFEAEDLANHYPEGPRQLASLYEHLISNLARSARKVELLMRVARLYEEQLEDPNAALLRWERAFREDPVRPKILDEIERLAMQTASWDLLTVVQGIRLSSIVDPLDRVDFICKCAKIAEDRMQDPVRAFRAYLRAFLLEPTNSNIQEELWRLATLIGMYAEDQRVSRPIEPDSLMLGGLRELARRKAKGELPEVNSPRGEHTQELEELDIEEIELDEFQSASGPIPLSSPTNSISLGELVEVRTGSLQGMTFDQIVEEYNKDISYEDILASSVEGADVSPPVSAWEEYARAWAMLPKSSPVEHVDHLTQMARIWKEGARNERKAFEVLGRAVTVNPGDFDIRAQFIEQGRALNMTNVCGSLLERIAGSISDDALAILLYRESAELYKEVSAWQKHEDVLRAVLALDNHHARAYEDLRDQLIQQEQWENVALLLEWKHELDDLPLEERIQLTADIATVYERHLYRLEVAHSWWMRALSMEPDRLEFLEAVLRLSKELKFWQKASEVLRRLADITDDEESQLVRLHELAHIMHRELDLPDQAIHVYREILQIRPSDPEAVSALDELYTQHELWEDLESILDTQIQNSAGELRNNFMERLADVLEKLGRPEEAAFLYEKLWQETQLPVFARKASAMFMETGRAADGVEILQGLLNSDNADYEPAEKAQLWTQLAVIQKRSLSSEAAARVSLEKALSIVPNHMEALQLLAEMALDHKDWEGFIEIERRIATSASDPTERDAALFLVARTFRDQLRDSQRARDAFLHLLRLNPQHQDAMIVLFALAEELQDWTLALSMLEQRFVYLTNREERARNLTRQAEIRLQYFEDYDTAYEILNEALDEDPNHVGAILALADLAERRGEWERASELLENALKKLKDEPGKMSRLARRYAQLMERTGKSENAITLLQEMERRYPDELPLKLTLGEIRYQQGRWRETVKLLGNLGDHPQAVEFAAEVANALCLAADAEIKQRKGGNAPVEMWEAAVRLKPDHLPAIEALIAFYLERGDQATAAGYLRAQAEAATNPQTRFSLYQSLGDLYLNQIKSKVDAYECYYNLWLEIEQPTVSHISILKTLVLLAEDLHREHEVLPVYKALLELGEDGDKLMLLVKAGEVALRTGDVPYAQEVLETAQKRAPANEKVLAALSELYESTGQHAATLRILQELAERKVGSAAEPNRRAQILKRLARAHMELGASASVVIPILQESIQLLPDDDETRRLLIRAFGEEPQYMEERSEQYQALLQRQPIDVRGLRDLVNQAYRQKDDERRFIFLQMLSLMGECSPEEEAWVATKVQRYERVTFDYANRLEEKDQHELESIAIHHPLVTVFDALWEAAPAVFGNDIQALGLSPQDRVSPVDKSDVAAIYQEISRVMGTRSTSLYLGKPEMYQGVLVACHAPPVMIVGRDALAEPPSTLRFYMARALELTSPKFIFAAGLYAEDFTKFLAALTRAFHPKYARYQFKTLDPVDEKAQELKKLLPYRVSKIIVEFFNENANLTFDSGAWRKSVWMVGNRFGLLLTGYLQEAMRIVLYEETQRLPERFTQDELVSLCAQNPLLHDLFAFFVSPLHVQLRRHLGLALHKDS